MNATITSPLTLTDIEVLANEIVHLFAYETTLRQRRFERLRAFDELEGWRLQGSESCAHWLSWRLGIDLKTANEHVRVARALGEYRKLDEAFSKGELSYSRVRALTRVVTPETEERLVELGKRSTAPELDRALRSHHRVSLTGDPRAVARALERRCLVWRELDSGLVEIVARVLPEEAAVVIASIDMTQKRMIEGGEPRKTPAEARAETSAEAGAETSAEAGAETSAEAGARVATSAEVKAKVAQRVDAFVATFEANLAPSTPRSVPGRHEVVVVVDAKSGQGELPDGSPIGPETIRRICCDSPLQVLVERAVDRSKPGAIEVGRRVPGVAPKLRRLLEVRDKTCSFPGCTNRLWVDAHHIEHWIDGGPTVLENLALTCRRHHVLVHEGGFTVQQTPEGPVFFDPQGRKIEKAPVLPNLGPDPLGDLEAGREAGE